MGLDMKTKRIITEVTAKRYRTTDRKGKTMILEFVKTTGCNRKYALHVLANGEKPPWQGSTARPSNSRREMRGCPKSGGPAAEDPKHTRMRSGRNWRG
jgi:hypothetical protein